MFRIPSRSDGWVVLIISLQSFLLLTRDKTRGSDDRSPVVIANGIVVAELDDFSDAGYGGNRFRPAEIE